MATGVHSSTGVAWVLFGLVLVAMVTVGSGDAGHFFAETPKHLPRIGRRGDLPPLATLMAEDDAWWAGVAQAVAGVESEGDGCVGVAELLRIPAVRLALLLHNPALLTPRTTPVAPPHHERVNSDTYTDHRPEPHLLRYLQK